jgi:hypothetical protein
MMGVRTTRRRGRTPGVLLLALCAIPLLVLPAAAETATVPTLVEAWYRTSFVPGNPLCGAPTGCPQPVVPANPPENTLLVESTLGNETARTYVSFDTSSVPIDGELTGGTATFPVAEASNLEAAGITACLVTEPIEPAEGGAPEDAPAIDCETSSEAAVVASATPPVVTVDLTPFVLKWASGTPDNGIALVVAEEEAAQRESWRVVFSAKEREAEGAEPITASVRFTLPPAEPVVAPPPVANEAASAPPPAPAPAPAPDVGFSPGSSDFSPPPASFALPAPFPPAPPAVAESVAGLPAVDSAFADEPALEDPLAAQSDVAFQPPAAPVAVPLATGYAYPAVWLVPLVLVGVAGLLGRSLTAEMVVGGLNGAGGASGAATTPGVFTRVWRAIRNQD